MGKFVEATLLARQPQPSALFCPRQRRKKEARAHVSPLKSPVTIGRIGFSLAALHCFLFRTACLEGNVPCSYPTAGHEYWSILHMLPSRSQAGTRLVFHLSGRRRIIVVTCTKPRKSHVDANLIEMILLAWTLSPNYFVYCHCTSHHHGSTPGQGGSPSWISPDICLMLFSVQSTWSTLLHRLCRLPIAGTHLVPSAATTTATASTQAAEAPSSPCAVTTSCLKLRGPPTVAASRRWPRRQRWLLLLLLLRVLSALLVVLLALPRSLRGQGRSGRCDLGFGRQRSWRVLPALLSPLLRIR